MAVTQNLKAVVTLGGSVDSSFKSVTGSLNKQLGSATKSVKELEREQAKLNKEIKKSKLAGANVEFLTNKYDRLGKELDEARRKQRQLASVSDFGGKLKKTATGLATVGAAVVGTAASVVGSLFAITNAQVGTMDSTQKLADSIGLSVETLQGYQYAAERSGVTTEQLNGAVEKMTRRTANFAETAGGPAKKALEKLGFAQKDLIGLSTDKKMELIADRLSQVGDEAYRNQIAFEIFGLKGTAMTNMLKGGSDGLRQLQKEAKATGWILDEASHRGAENFADSMLDAQLSIQGVVRQVSADLMPVFTSMMREFTGWISENRSQIKGWTAQFIDWARGALPVAVSSLRTFGSTVMSVITTVNDIANAFGGWKNVAIGVSAFIGVQMVASVATLGASVIGLVSSFASFPAVIGVVKAAMVGLNVVMRANPVGIMITAVGLLYTAFQTNFLGIRDIVTSVTNYVMGKVTWVFDKLKEVKDSVTGFFGDDNARERQSNVNPYMSGQSQPQNNRYGYALQNAQYGRSAGNQTTIGTIQVTAAPGQSSQEVAQAVHKKITGYENSLLSDIPQ